MSDSDGLAGSNSSDGGGVINAAGGVGAGHTTLSGAVEQADKAIRDMASAIIFGGDIDWNLLRNDLRRLSNGLDALDKLCLNLSADERKSADFEIMRLLTRGRLDVPLGLNMAGAFDPTVTEDGGRQEDDCPYSY